MKNKMSYSKLALGNLKHRKKQYTFLIIGIIISMFFSSASLFFVASTASSIDETTINLIGKEDLIIPHADQIKNCEDALKQSFKDVGLGSFMGLAVASNSKKNDGFIIAKFDESGKDMYTKVLKGKYPENKNEIAIEKEALLRAGFKDVALGDTITLKLYPQNKAEQLKKYEKAEFKVVGILQNRRVNIERNCQLTYTQLPAAAVSDDYRIPAGGKPATFALAYAGVDKNIKNYNECFKKFTDILGETGSLNFPFAEISMYVRWDWELTRSVNRIYMAAFFAIMMAVVANIGIVSSFSNNLKERKRQIGLLRSVGATKTQIRNIYLREAFILSLICTPISIILSLSVTYAVIPLFGEYFIFKPEFWTIPLSITASLIIVVLSSILPLIWASRISPMQAIRNFDAQRKLKKTKLKTNKAFDVSKLIAKRNINIMKAKNNLTSFTICVSIFVSCLTLAFAQIDSDELSRKPYDFDYLVKSTDAEGFSSFLANYEKPKGYNENDLYELLEAPYTKEVLSSTLTEGYIEVDKYTDYINALCYLNNDYSNSLQYNASKEKALKDTQKRTAEYTYVKEKADIQGEAISFTILALDDAALFNLKESYGTAKYKDIFTGEIDIDKMQRGEEVILVVPDEINILITNEDDGIAGQFTYVNTSWGSTLFYGDGENERLDPDFIYKCDFNVGDELKIGSVRGNKNLEFGEDVYELGENKVPPVYKKYENTAKIGAIANSIIDGFGSTLYYTSDTPTIIISRSALSNFTDVTDYTSFAINLNTESTNEIDKTYNDIFEEISLGFNYSVESDYERIQSNNEQILTWIIIILCVIFVMFTLSGSLVNNSITSRIHQGRRSIGTLRAVGASEKDLRSSYIRQFISVMLKGVTSGYIIFAIFCLIYYFAVRSYGEDFSGVHSPAYKYLFIPIAESAVPTLILFASCCVNMVTKIKKEMKNSIVENIREL